MAELKNIFDDAIRKQSRELAVLFRSWENDGVENVLAQFIHAVEKPQIEWLGRLRGPASSEEIIAAEKRLGFTLPESIRSFFLSANGVEALSHDFPCPILSIGEIRPGAESAPDINGKLLRAQDRHPEISVGDPLEVYLPNDGYAMAMGEPHLKIPLSELDSLVSLSPMSRRSHATFVGSPCSGLGVGTIVEIEGAKATVYANIKQWLGVVSYIFMERKYGQS